jgi:2-methylaconitate cis-trans-isomerase PrpF
MAQTAIPFLFLRGGTSRGPFIRREDLPSDRETLAEVLMAVLGAGHPLSIAAARPVAPSSGAKTCRRTARPSPRC